MNWWILSVVGVVAVGVLVDIVLDDKDLGKYIKGIFGIIVVLVILAPLPKMLKNVKKIDFVTKFDSVEIIDDSYLAIFENNIEYQEKELLTLLRQNEEAVQNVKIEIDKQNMTIKSICIIHQKDMINKQKVTQLVQKRLGKNTEIKFEIVV